MFKEEGRKQKKGTEKDKTHSSFSLLRCFLMKDDGGIGV
jgi:hypothetical protein